MSPTWDWTSGPLSGVAEGEVFTEVRDEVLATIDEDHRREFGFSFVERSEERPDGMPVAGDGDVELVPPPDLDDVPSSQRVISPG